MTPLVMSFETDSINGTHEGSNAFMAVVKAKKRIVTQFGIGREEPMINIIFDYIKMLYGIEMVSLFTSVGLFLLIRDVPLLKEKRLKKESNIIKILSYVYIFGSIILFIIIKNV